MKTFNLLSTLFLLLALISCSKDGPSDGGPEEEQGTTEYIAGYIRNGIDQEPALWENGVLTALPFNSGSNTRAVDVEVEGNDVYVLGLERSRNSFSRVSTILLWKNNEVSSITDGTKRTETIKLLVDQGNVYILGTETDLSEGSATTIFKYWKNGVPTTLNTQDASATDMVVVNNDVYISGDERGTNNKRVAKYWKNGVAVPVSDGSKDALGKSIAVQGADIAVLFEENNGQLFGNDLNVWKNGTISKLIGGSTYSTAKKIALENGIVHALSNERDGASDNFSSDKVVYWKGNVKTAITDGSTLADDAGMVVSGGDVYIAFHENNNERNPEAKSAKNGVVKVLSNQPEEAMESTAIVVRGGDEYVIGNSRQRAYVWKNGVETVISQNGFAADIFVK